MEVAKTIEVTPSQGPGAVYRRLSASRCRPNSRARTYYAHVEKNAVHSIGEVQIVFSTTKAGLHKATPQDVWILLSNDLELSTAWIVELYTLRWQIELFFKELKTTLGFDQYQFGDFEQVEGWCELTLLTFTYLELLRSEQRTRQDLTPRERQWWSRQRCHGLCQALRQQAGVGQLHYLSEQLQSPQGIEQLQQLLQRSYVAEYRAPL